MPPAAWFRLGRVLGAHGLGGLLKVRSDAQSVESFLAAGRVRIGESIEASADFVVRRAVPAKKHVLLDLEGIDGADQAQRLTGQEIFAARRDLPPLEEGEYYWADLHGARVVDQDGRPVGRLVRIINPGAHDVFVVRPEGDSEKDELLIPVVDRFVLDIDPTAGRIVVRVPEFQ
jgi:16S rRNA processing protein RimM